jgi:hypothetical protein
VLRQHFRNAWLCGSRHLMSRCQKSAAQKHSDWASGAFGPNRPLRRKKRCTIGADVKFLEQMADIVAQASRSAGRWPLLPTG